MNLPDDRASIHEIVDHSYRSFTGEITDPRLRTYVFVLIDRAKDLIVGTSMIVAQLGRRGIPYIYFDVLDEEKYSATIDKHFHHTVLRIGYSYNGPTEIGGLVLMPQYRLATERLRDDDLVRALSLPRLARARVPGRGPRRADAAARARRDEPPLGGARPPLLRHELRRGGSALQEEQRVHQGLFPEGVIYASVLPKEAQAVIGKTGAQTRGVEKLLRRIGFRYAHRVDPFDGGPHFTARMDEIKLVSDTRRSKADRPITATAADKKALIAVEWPEPPFFRAVMASVRDEGPRGHAVANDAWELLNLRHTSPLIVLPID